MESERVVGGAMSMVNSCYITAIQPAALYLNFPPNYRGRGLIGSLIQPMNTPTSGLSMPLPLCLHSSSVLHSV